MEIAVLPIGNIERPLLARLGPGIAAAFGRPVRVLDGLPVPKSAYDSARRQYSAVNILSRLAAKGESASFERTLGVFARDLFAADMNFVFGLAGVKAAVISLYRLRSNDSSIFEHRALTEAVHELGHTYGLRHCANRRCVMFFSNTLADTDEKGGRFCENCEGLLRTTMQEK